MTTTLPQGFTVVRIGTLGLVVLSLLTTCVNQWHRHLEHEDAQSLLTLDDTHEALNDKALPLRTHRRQLGSDDDHVYAEPDNYHYGGNHHMTYGTKPLSYSKSDDSDSEDTPPAPVMPTAPIGLPPYITSQPPADSPVSVPTTSSKAPTANLPPYVNQRPKEPASKDDEGPVTAPTSKLPTTNLPPYVNQSPKESASKDEEAPGGPVPAPTSKLPTTNLPPYVNPLPGNPVAIPITPGSTKTPTTNLPPYANPAPGKDDTNGDVPSVHTPDPPSRSVDDPPTAILFDATPTPDGGSNSPRIPVEGNNPPSRDDEDDPMITDMPTMSDDTDIPVYDDAMDTTNMPTDTAEEPLVAIPASDGGDITERFACIDIFSLQLEVWFHSDTDATCLNNQCGGPSECCRYNHDGGFLTCDATNVMSDYPCICTKYTRDPLSLPKSQAELSLPAITFPPTLSYSFFPTDVLETSTGAPSITEEPTAMPTAMRTSVPVTTTTVPAVPTTTTSMPTASTTGDVGMDVLSNTQVEKSPCVPFDQIAIGVVQHYRSHPICQINKCDTGCCRIGEWLTCESADAEPSDLPCVCSDYEASEETELANDEVESDALEPIAGVSRVSNAAEEGSNSDACVNGHPLYANPTFAHFIRCADSATCAQHNAGHCCLVSMCMCGKPATSSPSDECVTPFDLSTEPLPVNIVAEVEEPEEEDSDSTCIDGSMYQTLPNFQHMTPCVTTADCGVETANAHCCLKEYCMCGPPLADAGSECIGPFPNAIDEVPALTQAPVSIQREDNGGEEVIAIVSNPPTKAPSAKPSSSPTQFPTTSPSALPSAEAPMIPLVESTACLPWNDPSLEHSLSHPNAHETCQTNSCARGCCRAYFWMVCDEVNDFSFVPCVCNENTQDSETFTNEDDGADEADDDDVDDYEICKDGSSFHNLPGFNTFVKCYSADGCDEGECCLSRFCMCGIPQNSNDKCVPPAPATSSPFAADTVVVEEVSVTDPEEETGDELDLQTVPFAATNSPINSPVAEMGDELDLGTVPFPGTDPPTTVPVVETGDELDVADTTDREDGGADDMSDELDLSIAGLPGSDREDDTNSTTTIDTTSTSAAPILLPTSPPQQATETGGGIDLVETAACVPFEGEALMQANHPSSDLSCRNNNCPNGCCRSYWWLVCDETNEFSHAPCVCNENTQDPANFANSIETPAPTSDTPGADACKDGSFFQSHPSFSAMTPCYSGDECEAGLCCLSEYCVCGVPANSNAECVPVPDNNFPLDTVVVESMPATTADPVPAPTTGPIDIPQLVGTTPAPTVTATAPPQNLNMKPTNPGTVSAMTGNGATANTPTHAFPDTVGGTSTSVSSVNLIETVACVPFEGQIETHGDHPSTHETCLTNTCPNGCCRSYWWLVCDETNELSYAPCVCNENTQDPDNFIPNDQVTVEDSPARDEEVNEEDACNDGSIYHSLPSFRDLTPCFEGGGCETEGECCVTRFCLCMRPQSLDECLAPVPENVVLEGLEGGS